MEGKGKVNGAEAIQNAAPDHGAPCVALEYLARRIYYAIEGRRPAEARALLDNAEAQMRVLREVLRIKPL